VVSKTIDAPYTPGELSLFSAYSPRERTEPALAVAARLRASWGQSFAGLIDAEETRPHDRKHPRVHPRQRRDAIEAAGAGTA
jgi:hypothetical protein